MSGTVAVLRGWTPGDAEALTAAFTADPALERQFGVPLQDVGSAAGYLAAVLLDGTEVRRSFAVDVGGGAVGVHRSRTVPAGTGPPDEQPCVLPGGRPGGFRSGGY